MSNFANIGIRDGANLDAFSRLRVSSPNYLFDAQLTYDLQPLLYEQIASGTGATVTYDSTNRCATMTFSSTPSGGKSYMQSYEWIPYQPGRSQLAFITFNMLGGVANTLKFAGLGDDTNGIRLELNGTTLQASIYSGTGATNTVAQSSWNLDKMDGTGRSGVTIDMSKTQILVIDYQALYVGRVRLGFDIGGNILYFHEFTHANNLAVPYIQIASLPIRVGMTCTGTVSTTMRFICASVMSEGGSLGDNGFSYAATGSGTAGNNTAAHILSVRPITLFNSVTNRSKFILQSIDTYISGNTAVRFDLVLGQAISGTTTFTSVNSSYSSMESNTAGTISGSPAITLLSVFNPSGTSSKSSSTRSINQRAPITLDAAGAVRANGTLSVIATGLGATSACQASLNWLEVR